MEASIIAEIAQLRELKAAALRVRYREVCGEESRSSNRQFLFRRIAWRLQVRAEGDLSERARRRASEIADDADLRLRAPEGLLTEGTSHQIHPPVDGAALRRDPRVPLPGTLLTRVFENRRIVVTALKDGFEYEPRRYRSFSPTGYQCGPLRVQIYGTYRDQRACKSNSRNPQRYMLRGGKDAQAFASGAAGTPLTPGMEL